MSSGELSGYKKPPAQGRYQKGRSGNPRGRPPGSRKQLPYDAVLGQMVTIREGGGERRVTAEEAFLLQLNKQGLEGDGAAARAALAVIEEGQARGLHLKGPFRSTTIIHFIESGSVSTALQPLRMARKQGRYLGTVEEAMAGNSQLGLEPWIVEAALNRLAGKRLTVEEQRTVVQATRTPRKVKWPEWWEITA